MGKLKCKYSKFSAAFTEVKVTVELLNRDTDKHEDMWKWNSTKRTLTSRFIELSLSQMMAGYTSEIKMRGIVYKRSVRNDYYMPLWLWRRKSE